MLPILVLLVSVLAAQCQAERVYYSLEDAEYHFEQFITTFSKHYETEEEKNYRLNIFKENLKNIIIKNANGPNVVGITQFSDLTPEEFIQKHTGFKRDSNRQERICQKGSVPDKKAPESKDWRKENKVTHIKNQATCGSCWTFSVSGNLEGQYAIKHNKLMEISEQQLVDCDSTDARCNGGVMTKAFMWLKNNGGAMLENDYPYEARNGTSCRFDKSKVAIQVTDCLEYAGVTEDQLKQILAEVGPLSIGVASSSLTTYIGGVFECDPMFTQIDHAVLLVGYGKEGDKPYWIIKNSWGTQWGEEGYARLAMYKNSCQMMSEISTAVVA